MNPITSSKDMRFHEFEKRVMRNPTIHGSAKAVFWVVLSEYFFQNQSCIVSYPIIAERTGLSVSRIGAYVKLFTKLGVWKPKRRTNGAGAYASYAYEFNWDWQPESVEVPAPIQDGADPSSAYASDHPEPTLGRPIAHASEVPAPTQGPPSAHARKSLAPMPDYTNVTNVPTNVLLMKGTSVSQMATEVDPNRAATLKLLDSLYETYKREMGPRGVLTKKELADTMDKLYPQRALEVGQGIVNSHLIPEAIEDASDRKMFAEFVS